MFQKLISLFSRKPKVNIDSLSAFGVDMHSHLIAGIDDGVKVDEEAIEIIKRYKELGYTKIITTPHTMSGGYDNTPETILGGLDQLKLALKEAQVEIDIEAASEYYLDGHFEQLLKEESLLTFGDNYILFELSYMFKPNNLETVIFELNLSQYKPILAHPERYPYLADKNLEKLEKVRDQGVDFQLNLFSLVNAYGPGAKDIAEKLVDAEMVDFVGTDIHNPMQLQYMDACLKNEYVAKLLEQPQIKNLKLLNA